MKNIHIQLNTLKIRSILKRGEKMQLNKICIVAIVLFIIFAILKFAIKLSWKLFLLGIVISIIVAVVGWFKGDELV